MNRSHQKLAGSPRVVFKAQNGCSRTCGSKLQLVLTFTAGADEQTVNMFKWSGIPIKAEWLGYAGFRTS
jgi:hypothetical protein